MTRSVFAEIWFWLVVIVSVALPFGIYGVLMVKRAISRTTVLFLGFSLIGVAALDVYVLQRLTAVARLTPSLADDAIFVSEVSLALYLLPFLFGGIGVNVVSHILVAHLVEAEERFKKEHPDAG